MQLLCCGRNIGTTRSAIGYCTIPIYLRRELGVLMKSWKSSLKCSESFSRSTYYCRKNESIKRMGDLLCGFRTSYCDSALDLLYAEQMIPRKMWARAGWKIGEKLEYSKSHYHNKETDNGRNGQKIGEMALPIYNYLQNQYQFCVYTKLETLSCFNYFKNIIFKVKIVLKLWFAWRYSINLTFVSIKYFLLLSKILRK